MDMDLESLNNYVVTPITGLIEGFVVLPKQTKHFIMMAATIGLSRNPSLFQQTGDSYGLFHIKEEQHSEIWDHYLVKNPDLASTVRGLASQRQFLHTPHTELCTNLNYATAIAAFALSIHKQSFQVGLTLHQQVALLNAVFPGFKGISRKEWQQATIQLKSNQSQPLLLRKIQDKAPVAVCA